jgi:hypothetical protein
MEYQADAVAVLDRGGVGQRLAIAGRALSTRACILPPFTYLPEM